MGITEMSSSETRNGDETAHLSPRSQLLIETLTRRGFRFGREDSFKLSRHRFFGDRILLGTPAKDLDCEALLQMSSELGMPPCYQPLLLEHFVHSNMVLFGLEDGPDGGVFKVYLELWEQLRHRVLTTGSSQPGLLNVGVKWDTVSGAHCRADYVCLPMLSVGEILGRLERLYGDQRAAPSYDFSVQLIRQAAARNPKASFIYVEVSEAGSHRKSFDINLYKANLTVGAAGPQLIGLGQQYEIDGPAFERYLAPIQERCLGHLSGGFDRLGRDFATIYYEISML
jgi:hypothetical protein